jgi:hypothetical protein
MTTAQPTPRLSYHNVFFRYGEILLLCEPDGADTERLEPADLRQLPRVLADLGIRGPPEKELERIVDPPLEIVRDDQPRRLLLRVKLSNWISPAERQALVGEGNDAYDPHHAKQRRSLIEVSDAVKRLNEAIRREGVQIGALRLTTASPNWLAAPFQCG